ncbi:MAG TPA: transcriptional repressor LexA [Armatimonadota bacterium]|nr:transcriptional repressor LexA [Armatimonadota bacterium]
MEGLTRRQQEVLSGIRAILQDTGHPPTVRELGEKLGLRSSCTVQRHLEALERKGFIRRNPTKARTIEITRGPKPLSRAAADGGLVSLPIVGTVTAGLPILAVENVEDTLALPRTLVSDGECFALRVRGDSMINAGLYDGDLAVVKKQETAGNGDVVVALLDDEATIKRFFRDSGRVKLQAENPAYEPIIVDKVVILGKVVMSIHKF